MEDFISNLKTVVLNEDIAFDVYSDFMEKYRRNESMSDIQGTLASDYADALEDKEDMPLFWLAPSLAQYELGILQPDVLEKVSELIQDEESFIRWKGLGMEQFQAYQTMLRSFLRSLVYFGD